MFYINRGDYPALPYRTMTDTPEVEYGQNSTVKTSGCGLCSALMAGDRLIPNFSWTIEQAVQFSYDIGANHQRGTDYLIFAPAFAKKFGLSLEITDDPEKLLQCLRTGGAAVAHCRQDDELNPTPLFTKMGHFVCVIAQQADGRLCVLDPNVTPGKFDTPYRKERVEQKGDICLCSVEDMVKETSPKAPNCFYLFNRF